MLREAFHFGCATVRPSHRHHSNSSAGVGRGRGRAGELISVLHQPSCLDLLLSQYTAHTANLGCAYYKQGSNKIPGTCALCGGGGVEPFFFDWVRFCQRSRHSLSSQQRDTGLPREALAKKPKN